MAFSEFLSNLARNSDGIYRVKIIQVVSILDMVIEMKIIKKKTSVMQTTVFSFSLFLLSIISLKIDLQENNMKKLQNTCIFIEDGILGISIWKCHEGV